MLSAMAKVAALAIAMTAQFALLSSAQANFTPPVIQPQLFSAKVSLGRALPSIPIPGGVRLSECSPLLNHFP